MLDSNYIDNYIEEMEYIRYHRFEHIKTYNDLIREKDMQIRQLNEIVNKRSVKLALKLSSAWQKFLGWFRKRVVIREAQTENEDREEQEYTQSVSAIIPTKNGGTLFEIMIRELACQLLVPNLEIIVVDSGSTDHTLMIAEFFGAKVIQIQPEEFSHSYARNLGAKEASGDFLLFMTQDAIPTDAYWLYHLMTPLVEGKVVAASPMEIQRDYGDLKYKIDSWNHNRYLGISGQDRIGTLPEKSDFDSLRKNAQLVDIACMVRKDIFIKYSYVGDFAEDLRLGLNIIKGGNAIALLSSVQVIHGHERPGSYYMKRHYVDVKTLKDIFDDYPVTNRSRETFISGILCGYAYINAVINRIHELQADTLESLFSKMEGFFQNEKPLPAAPKCPYVEDEVESLVLELSKWNPENTSNYEMCEQIKVYVMEGMYTFLQEHRDRNTESLQTDICETIYKTFCGMTGVYFAEYVLVHGEDKEIVSIAEKFQEGV